MSYQDYQVPSSSIEKNLDLKSVDINPESSQHTNKKVTNTSKRGRNKAKGLIEVEPVVGTRDFYPDKMKLRTWLFDKFRQTAQSYCFQVSILKVKNLL